MVVQGRALPTAEYDGHLVPFARTVGMADALGTIAKSATLPLDRPQTLLFWLQHQAKKLLPKERVSQCLSAPVPGGEAVKLSYSDTAKRARYENLVVCSRVWQCPVCARRITEQRRRELTKAINESGLHAIMVTVTLRHKYGDDCDALVQALTSAWRSFTAGAAWKRKRNSIKYVGYVRALEVTHGDNGWHPHCHVLMLLEKPLTTEQTEDLEAWAKKRWQAKLEKRGYSANYENGLDIKNDAEYIANYVAKWGKEPEDGSKAIQGNAENGGWTVVHEITKSVTKRGRAGNRTPQRLLVDYGNGDKQAGALYQEYVAAFKGRAQLVWSRGLKALLKIDEIRDEECQETEADDWREMAQWTPKEWRRTWAKLKAWRRGELLDIASSGDDEKLKAYLVWAEKFYGQPSVKHSQRMTNGSHDPPKARGQGLVAPAINGVAARP